MSQVDPAFRNIPKNSTFFIIWRIEKMELVLLSQEHYSTFYTGDSYIVACATEHGERGDSSMKPKPARRGLDIHIHFWLGSQTSRDEAGVAAYKTVELDEFLGGSPVQHREVEGHESKQFLSYFRKGIRLLSGGISSGLKHVDTSFQPRLFHVKGKRRPVVRQINDITWNNMNDGDVFVLEAGKLIFVWSGRYANNMEKIQGARLAQELKAEGGEGSIVTVDDGKEKSLTNAEKEVFNKWLPITEKKLKSYKDVVADDVIERKLRKELKLYKCCDEGGTLKVTEVKSGPLDQSDLTSQDSYIIDNGEAGIWVWVGKRANTKERTEAMRNAQGFIKKKNYRNYTQVTRVIEGGEPPEFQCLFRTWRDPHHTIGLGKTHNVGKIAKTIQTKFDATTLHSNIHLAAEVQMVDDGKGTKEVFRIQSFDLVRVDQKEIGKFFSGDCYVVVYAYNNDEKDNFMIYYWLGAKSTADEQGTAAFKTIELDEKLNGRAVQVRVVQGKEPPHFMAIFGGKMIILEGGYASGFRNVENNNSCYSETSRLLHVRGTSDYNTKAIQVEKRAASLNSNDVFVLLTTQFAYVWAGKGSTGDEREMAKKIVSQSGREIVLVSEGQEKQEFWNALGGKEHYANNQQLQMTDDNHQPRLFQCSNASGRFVVEEIIGFIQSDLVEDDIMLLDAWNTIFIWIGNRANAEEKRRAMSVAEEYLQTDPSGRESSTPIVKVKQGLEPPNFTGFFGVWDRSLWNKNKTYDEVKAELAQENPGVIVVRPQTNGKISSPDVDKFPLEILQIKDPEELPESVDPSSKEIHLTDEDFLEAFGISFSSFQDLPKWRQVEMKKKIGLF
ncbi:villin-1-like [Tachypleus tridentatus]|uniref:villin-1-like n=1 Tax=Tachypleus tridentatus TaxID=6853 RepID=UPI003FD62E90